MSSRGNILFDYVYYLFFNKKYTILKMFMLIYTKKLFIPCIMRGIGLFYKLMKMK